jgi:hypothetical protein
VAYDRSAGGKPVQAGTYPDRREGWHPRRFGRQPPGIASAPRCGSLPGTGHSAWTRPRVH